MYVYMYVYIYFYLYIFLVVYTHAVHSITYVFAVKVPL